LENHILINKYPQYDLFAADACDYATCDYGVVGPRNLKNNDSQVALGDKKLASAAQMFHYQHQKNQIIAMENRNGDMGHNDEDNDSDENENDFTVYGNSLLYINLIQ
jgi:hypothetical protein